MSGAGSSSSTSDAARAGVKPGDRRSKYCIATPAYTIDELELDALTDTAPASAAGAPDDGLEEALSLAQLIQRAEIMFLDAEHSPKPSVRPRAAEAATLRVICEITTDEVRLSRVCLAHSAETTRYQSRDGSFARPCPSVALNHPAKRVLHLDSCVFCGGRRVA